jgi:hypothetical protein
LQHKVYYLQHRLENNATFAGYQGRVHSDGFIVLCAVLPVIALLIAVQGVQHLRGISTSRSRFKSDAYNV